MIAVSEEMKNEDLKDPSNMEQEASEETASENTETSAEEKTTEKAPEKEGFFKKKKDPKDEKIEELTDRVKRQMAEFDNFRKRTEKEKSTMYEMGAKDIIELPFRRAKKIQLLLREWKKYISSSRKS